MSRWVRAALDGESIDVYHPENLFDYVYSRDVAEGLLRMATDDDANGPINLGSGRSRRVGDVRDAIEAATGRPLNSTRHSVDEPYEGSQADPGRIRQILDWAPRTSLEEGIARVVEFERGAPRNA